MLNTSLQKNALIIFAREPKDGKVKTRLARDLPVKTVTSLYKAFVKDVLSMCLRARCDQRFIFYAGSNRSINFLKRFTSRFTLKRQSGTSLGIRMMKALSFCHAQDFDKALIVGTDCLEISPKDIEKAFKLLDRVDVVLGPSRDGGYYLIGMKKPIGSIFEGVQWSSEKVLIQTLQKIQKVQKSYALLSKKEDVDTIKEVKNLSENDKILQCLSATKNVLKRIKFKNER